MYSSYFVAATADRFEVNSPDPQSRGVGMAIRAVNAMRVWFAAARKPLPHRSDPAQQAPFLDTEPAYWSN